MNEEEKKAIKIINAYIERKRAIRTVFNTEDIIFDNIIILLGLLEKQTELEKRNKKDYISKDKIRKIIEHYNNELEHIKNGEEFENEKPMYYWGKVALENLLEEN